MTAPTPESLAALIAAGRAGEAAQAAAEAVRLHPGDPSWLNVQAYALHILGAGEAAAAAARNAIRLAPHEAVFHNTLGAIELQRDRDADAESAFREALRLRSDYVEAALNLTKALLKRGETASVVTIVESLLARHAEDPRFLPHAGAAAQTLAQLGRGDSAARAAQLAASHAPVAPAVLRLARGGDGDAAIDALLRQVRLDPRSRDARFALSSAYEARGRLAEARATLTAAIADGHDDPNMLSTLAVQKARACEWAGLDSLVATLRGKATIPSARPASPGHAMYFEGVTALEQRAWAQNWARVVWPHDVARPAARPRKPGERLRVGFLSADFREHPTSRLMVAMLEEHDRERFEMVAYSHRASDHSPMRARIERAFDRCVEVGDVPAGQAAERIRADAPDLVFDLGGYTRGSRLDILAYRAAPVQGHLLGYPATTGAPFVDFFVSDAIATPPGGEAGFTERLAMMPGSCQPNDPRRALPDAPSRASCGLRDDALVLCSFNQPIKLTRTVFTAWCELLRAIPNACLWLLSFDRDADANIAAEARAHGIDPARLVFAPRAAPDDHIARLRNADIALESFPCTSHTTASDAVWAGVPLMTVMGETFAARMAGSVLTAAGLGDWCYPDVRSAVDATGRLARDPEQLQVAKARAAAARASSLFDARTYARDFESLLESLAPASP